ncbi:MAG: hypothetical protein ACI8UO_001094 [Verrucomicrobiales bacterium]|jgi:hypothetical protein
MPKKSNWSLGAIRFTYFDVSPAAAPDDGLFERFFGVPPEEEVSRKAEFSTRRMARGDGVVYQMINVGPKVDFLLDAEADETQEPSIGGLLIPDEEETRRLFLKSVDQVVLEMEEGAVSRLAVGERYLIPASSHEDGYRILGGYLKGVDLSMPARDFQYRINRPREIVVQEEKLTVNRLSSWSCLALQKMVVGAGFQSGSSPAIAALVTTDVSTDIGLNLAQLPHRVSVDALPKLFTISQEITEKGDVK